MGEPLKILVDCEESQVVCKELPGIANAMAPQWSEDLGFTNEETFLR